MTPGVFNLNHLRFYLAKYGQFWNPHNKQISKLILLFEFGQEEPVKMTKNKLVVLEQSRMQIKR